MDLQNPEPIPLRKTPREPAGLTPDVPFSQPLGRSEPISDVRRDAGDGLHLRIPFPAAPILFPEKSQPPGRNPARLHPIEGRGNPAPSHRDEQFLLPGHAGSGLGRRNLEGEIRAGFLIPAIPSVRPVDLSKTASRPGNHPSQLQTLQSAPPCSIIHIPFFFALARHPSAENFQCPPNHPQRRSAVPRQGPFPFPFSGRAARFSKKRVRPTHPPSSSPGKDCLSNNGNKISQVETLFVQFITNNLRFSLYTVFGSRKKHCAGAVGRNGQLESFSKIRRSEVCPKSTPNCLNRFPSDRWS